MVFRTGTEADEIASPNFIDGWMNAKLTVRSAGAAMLMFCWTGCSRHPSGVYYQDFSFVAAQNPDTPNAGKGFQDFLAQHGKDSNIRIDGDHLELVMGKQFHLRGTFKVSGNTLYLTPELIDSQPLGVTITNADSLGRSGRKFTSEMYMPDDNTIYFMGATFRRSG
jgi:hypothetical protein